MTKEKSVKLSGYAILLLIAVFTAFLIFRGYHTHAFQSKEAFKNYISQYGALAPLALVLFQVVQVVVPIIPSFLGYAAGVALFGIWGGFFYNYLGIALGSLLAFLLSRYLGVHFIKTIIKEESYNKCTAWLESKKSFSLALFGAILLPFAPDDILCYLAGLTKMSFQKFTAIIVIGKPWCILGYCLAFGGFM